MYRLWVCIEYKGSTYMKSLDYLNSALRREHKVGKACKRTLRKLKDKPNLHARALRMIRTYRVSRKLRRLLSPVKLDV